MGPLTAATPVVLQGVPREFDALLRQPARLVLHGLGLVGTALLASLGAWWWAPVPLAASFLAYEAFFWLRSDKPLRLELGRDAVRVHDRFLGQDRVVPLEGLRAATLAWRTLEAGQIEVVLILADADAIRLGLQLRLAAGAFRPEADDVDLDAANGVLGAIRGAARAMAPREVLVRQVFDDSRAVDWFRGLPRDVRARRAVRFWRGRAPPLDLFGYHADAPDGLAVFDGATVSFSDGPGPAPLAPSEPELTDRPLVLFQLAGDEGIETHQRLPLWVQPVGGRRFAIPAPLAAGMTDLKDATDDLMHLHAAEGGVLMWHLWHQTPRSQWPRAWVEALEVARPTLERWPDWLRLGPIAPPGPTTSVTVPPPPDATP